MLINSIYLSRLCQFPVSHPLPIRLQLLLLPRFPLILTLGMFCCAQRVSLPHFVRSSSFCRFLCLGSRSYFPTPLCLLLSLSRSPPRTRVPLSLRSPYPRPALPVLEALGPADTGAGRHCRLSARLVTSGRPPAAHQTRMADAWPTCPGPAPACCADRHGHRAGHAGTTTAAPSDPEEVGKFAEDTVQDGWAAGRRQEMGLSRGGGGGGAA